MTTTPALDDDLVRPIVGIENRTPQEVFDIMADRFRRRSEAQSKEIEALRSALKPFAAEADARKSKDLRDAVCFSQSLLLAARTALKGA